MERTRPDGRVLEVRNNPVPGGGAVLIYSDITKRKRAEAEIRAALERQTATADILKVTASSPTDVQPVLDVVAKAAVRFCGTTDALVQLKDGDETVVSDHEGPLRGTLGRRRPIEGYYNATLVEGLTSHHPDVQNLDAETYAPLRKVAAEVGFRARLAAPLLREGIPIGAISLRRIEPGAFTPQQIELLETFAAQAVIAIENVRLFTELRESLDQQTAPAEVLRVISQSPTDVRSVLDAVAAAACRFCGAPDASIILRDGDEIMRAAHKGPLGITGVGSRESLNSGTVMGRSIIDREIIHVPNVDELDTTAYARAQEIARRTGWRSAIAAPMLREDAAIGCILLRRPDQGPFTPRQIELLKTLPPRR